MTDGGEVLAYMHEVAERAQSGSPPAESASVPLLAPAQPHIERAQSHASMGANLAGDARLRSLKRAVLRVNALITREQVEYNHATLRALTELSQRLGALYALLAAVEMSLGGVDDMERRIEDLEEEAQRLRVAVRVSEAARAAERERARAELRSQHALLNLVLRDAARAAAATGAAAGVAAAREFPDDLYLAIADIARGSREEVEAQLREFVPCVAASISPSHPLLDAGSGRGEWLEVMRDAGLCAYGVDRNAAMVAVAAGRGLDARHGDVLEHLRGLPESSLGAVTAFHVVEHLTTDEVADLVALARRALRPGGVLVVETPNPENPRVAAVDFHLDPTRLRPLHPRLLEHVVVSSGFCDVEVRMRAVPAGGGADGGDAEAAALEAPRDYAVVGTRPGTSTP